MATTAVVMRFPPNIVESRLMIIIKVYGIREMIMIPFLRVCPLIGCSRRYVRLALIAWLASIASSFGSNATNTIHAFHAIICCF